VSPRPKSGITGSSRTSLRSEPRKASSGPTITDGRTIVAVGKAARTAASPSPRLRM
jgi:hypothetical protein